MKMLIKTIPFALVFVVAACQHTAPLGRDYGNSVSHNESVQVIDPAPSYEGMGPPDMLGTRASNAIRRYDTGNVIRPEAIDTTN